MQKNNLDETTNLLLNNEYSLNDNDEVDEEIEYKNICLLYTSPSPRDTR